jgi:ABC-type branched-subunit amino acid transport system substrate-binding protein
VRRQTVRFLAVLLALVMVAAACGDDDDDTSSGGTATTEAGSGGGEPEAVPGFDGTTIKLGVITPLTDRVAVIGLPLTKGTETYFAKVNAAGGIAGKYKVELDIQDSKYDPPTAVQLYNGMKGDIVMIAQLLGTPIVNAVLAQLKTDKVVAQPASLDSFWVREQNLIPVGGPYQIQAINALDYYLKNGGEGKRICSLIQDDPYGEAGQEGVEFAAEELGFELGTTQRFKVTDQDFTAQITALKGCDAVFGVVTAASLSGILTAAVQNNFAPRWILQSPAWLSVFAASPLKDYLVQNVWVLGEGPAWGDASVEGMKQLLDDTTKYAPDQKPDQYYAFGWAAAWAVTQVLEKAVEMGDLSRDGIIAAMNSLDTISVGGLLGDYGWGEPADRVPPSTTSINKVNPELPVGLEQIERDYESDAAKEFSFDN